MRQIKIEQYTIDHYTDIYEWLKEFYDLPEGGTLDGGETLETMGFAEIDSNKISIFTCKESSYESILAHVAHELGHIIECPVPKNPPREDGFDHIHEQKAEFYENFVLLVHKVVSELGFKNDCETIA